MTLTAPRTAVRRVRTQKPGLTASLAPNWFAAVMGTGIVATAATALSPGRGLHELAVGAWLTATATLVVLAVGTLTQWVRHRAIARSHLRHPVVAHFYGAPPMAVLTVGAGALLVGGDLIGERAALVAASTLWTLGTAMGLVSAVLVPYRHITGGLGRADAAFGGWLMSVVPPMVSATTGAALLPHLPAGQPRLTLLLALYGLFGVSLIASVVIITQIWARLLHHGLPPAKMVPTLWIVLGPLGQSVTAAVALGRQADSAIADPYATALRAFGVVYGVPVLGFALLWAVLAFALTLHTARTPAGLPFAPTWWAFTFPVGTCATGAAGLAGATGALVLEWLAVALFTGLLTGWIVAATGSLNAARVARRPVSPAWSYTI
ncbi:TDT family transporter [Kineosporia succinea]|uniref:C4-dicarboxylate transporter/malic acid transport protein n=1 Tax=Kineosporia succinea TaxID=84632 RepID=A0ABT9NZL3_9ACTN|nr:TDT family transporter [Kineosporia succinea]MDP9825873.1 C4-dicarboxylate transporter/malic acid transport protein [Kineosporia succinea]